MNTIVDTNVFLTQYDKEYQLLYNNNDEVAGKDEACAWYCDMLQCNAKFREFVRQCAIVRQDGFMSDRECAAFAFACEHFDLF